MAGFEGEGGRGRCQRGKQGRYFGGVGLVVPMTLRVVGLVAQKGVHNGAVGEGILCGGVGGGVWIGWKVGRQRNGGAGG